MKDDAIIDTPEFYLKRSIYRIEKDIILLVLFLVNIIFFVFNIGKKGKKIII